MLNLFAHDGHAHEASPSFFETSEGFVLMNAAPFILLVLIVLLLFRLQVKTSTLLSISLVFLLAVGLLGYRYVPIASIVSLVAGFGFSLAWVVLPFKSRK